MVFPENILFEILLNSSYLDVINTAKSSSKFFTICRKPYFWACKAEKDFGISGSDLKLITGKNNKAKYEWIINITPNAGLLIASEIGNLRLATYFLSKGVCDYNWAMAIASLMGHFDLVKLLIEERAGNYNWSMVEAVKGGHIDIVKYLIEKGADDFYQGLLHSAREGYMEIVKLMVEKGASSLQWAKEEAKRNNHLDIVTYLEIFINIP